MASGVIAVEERMHDGEEVQDAAGKSGALAGQWSSGRANPVVVNGKKKWDGDRRAELVYDDEGAGDSPTRTQKNRAD